MVNSSGVTTRFSWPFCSILPRQTSMCLLTLRDIKVLLFYSTSIPDIVVISKRMLYAIELTVCFETNFQKSRKYKMNRYKNLSNEVFGNYIIKKLFIEISTLGFYTNDLKPFINFSNDLKINDTDRMLKKCSSSSNKSFIFP